MSHAQQLLAFVNQAAPDYQEKVTEDRRAGGIVNTGSGKGS